MRNLRNSMLMLVFVLTILITGCSTDSSNSNDDTGDNESSGQEAGGTLNIGLDAQPPTLDLPTSGTIATRDVARVMFETLLTTDANNQAVPMLAESVDTTDNQTYTFKLRQGVKFHNDKEMIAEDVIASMERWAGRSSNAGSIFEGATWEAEDDYTVVLTLAQASALALDSMAATKMGAAIMPKEVIDAIPEDGVDEIEEYVGTGPYKFVEWKQDQYIKFERYDDYQAVEAEPDGLSGKKEALFDEIYFHMASDSSTRLTGLQSGDYDFIFGVPYDSYDQLESDPNLKTYLAVNGVEVLKFNSVEGLGTNAELRQVINTGLDINAAMMAAFPSEDLYWLHSGYMDEDLVNWASDAGSEYHNINDQEKAKQMLADMDYDGEPFRILTTRDYAHLYNVAVVVHEQLRGLGINAELEIYDWPTLVDIANNQPDRWEAHMISYSVTSTPPQFLGLDQISGGGVHDERVIDLMSQIETAPTLEEAKEIWDELQLYSWEELLPIIQFGSFHSLYGSSDRIEGITTYSGPVFWNAGFVE
ncbi:ABC transporter substrate-binding protein [Ornithinibacillus sp. 4-3]|uniref:ABC transporter substrate-binding protein n=1 Tax=Ornithinibacillus sp. 4-3 TaxID=3231488 RepID=A0AB39HVS7_9BACI